MNKRSSVVIYGLSFKDVRGLHGWVCSCEKQAWGVSEFELDKSIHSDWHIGDNGNNGTRHFVVKCLNVSDQQEAASNAREIINSYAAEKDRM